MFYILALFFYILILILLSGCSAKFDSFDPMTSTLRWVITNSDKGVKNEKTDDCLDEHFCCRHV